MTLTENFGSQLSHFSCLYAIAKKTGHRIVFLDQYASLGRGLKFHLPFEPLPFEILDVNQLTADERIYSNYPIDLQVPVNSGVFFLDKSLNINFKGFFTSYRYWYPIRHEIRNIIQFKTDVVYQAKSLIQALKSKGQEIVSVHVRRTDYLENGAQAFNPSCAYYEEAFLFFPENNFTFIIFSDDIPWCKSAFSNHPNFFYSEGNLPEVDMCAMSLCEHNIIANSTFSFWGAFLNKNMSKKVICPGKYMKTDHIITHMNYCWFPDDFIPLDTE